MNKNIAKQKKLISIICPVFNEEKAIPLFYERIQKIIAALTQKYEFDLIFANNRSVDKSLEILCELREKNPSVQILTMSRNFGYQASVQAALSYASGDGIIVIDVDCEDPPEMIHDFLEQWENGFDIVYGIRKDREEWWVIKKLRNLFYHLLRMTADMDIVLYMAEFALISSHVRDAIINNKNTFPFLRAEIGYAGFSKHGITYKRAQREKGKTHYNIFGMVSFGVAGILTSSTFLLRLAGYILPVFVLGNIILLIMSFYGFAEAFRIMLAINLTYIVSLLTIHGIYLARVYKNAMDRPVFIIDHKKSYLNNPQSLKTTKS